MPADRVRALVSPPVFVPPPGDGTPKGSGRESPLHQVNILLLTLTYNK